MKLKVTTHSGEDDIVEVDSYEPGELNAKMNDHEIHSIIIGKNIYSRIDLKNIKVIED